jgi:hypothetical protein
MSDGSNGSYPLVLIKEREQIHIVNGYDAPPISSDRGVFMRTIPMQQAVVVDEHNSQRMLEVSNRIPPDSVRTPRAPRTLSNERQHRKRQVGQQPWLDERMYILPDHSKSSSSSSSIVVDSANKFYLFSISLLGLYMFYRIMQRSAEAKVFR